MIPSPGTRTGPSQAAALAATPGVRRVEPIQHRFAYVGADLQDLYGVRPGTISSATALQDAYFQGGTAAQLIGVLTAKPDAVLVSAEASLRASSGCGTAGPPTHSMETWAGTSRARSRNV